MTEEPLGQMKRGKNYHALGGFQHRPLAPEAPLANWPIADFRRQPLRLPDLRGGGAAAKRMSPIEN